MRTTIDIPDGLLERAKPLLAERKMTLRAVVIDALEQILTPSPLPFRLRDASAGYGAESGAPVSSAAINQAIEDLGEPSR